jgi:hypothetical protein
MSISNQKISEARLQYELVQWLQLNKILAIHCPNGEERNIKVAMKLTAMGVRAGVPDLMIPLPDGKILWIELKLAKGKLSKPQVKMIELLESLNHQVLVVYADSLLQAKEILIPELSKTFPLVSL